MNNSLKIKNMFTETNYTIFGSKIKLKRLCMPIQVKTSGSIIVKTVKYQLVFYGFEFGKSST